ncbi:MAG: nucleotidyl transferase AbiEii/AbiGii toxin family protein [Vulcanimicrobiota bacterium]
MRFLELDRAGRREVFERAARELGRSPLVLEKDLWVCWCLERVFGSDLKPKVVFKGGTSLSKVYRVIDRFSEDIDLTVSKLDLGFTESDHDLSKTKLKQKLEAVSRVLSQHLEKDYLPLFLEESEVSARFSERNSNTVLVHYPSVYPSDTATYIEPLVRLEFGARNPIEPSERHEITFDAKDIFPQLTFPATVASVLSARRIFWEKATLLHMLYYCAHEKLSAGRGERQARHYYDLVKLAEHDQGKAALEDDFHLLEVVSRDKSILFPADWARYQEAKHGTLRLVPNAALSEFLADDFQKMIRSGMFGTQPPSWSEILEVLKSLEARINS